MTARRVCAWCEKDLGLAAGGEPGQVTHTLCDPCVVRELGGELLPPRPKPEQPELEADVLEDLRREVRRLGTHALEGDACDGWTRRWCAFARSGHVLVSGVELDACGEALDRQRPELLGILGRAGAVVVACRVWKAGASRAGSWYATRHPHGGWRLEVAGVVTTWA